MFPLNVLLEYLEVTVLLEYLDLASNIPCCLTFNMHPVIIPWKDGY